MELYEHVGEGSGGVYMSGINLNTWELNRGLPALQLIRLEMGDEKIHFKSYQKCADAPGVY